MNSKENCSDVLKRKDRKMKKTKIIQRTVSSFLAAAMLATLSSCDLPGKSMGGSEIPNQPRQIVNYYTTEMFQKPYELGFIRNVFTSGENIYLYGYRSNESYDKVSGLYNMETKELKEVNIENINYEYLSMVYNLGDTIAVNYSEKDSYENKIALVDKTTGEVIADKATKNDSYVSSITPNGDGTFTVVETSYGIKADVSIIVFDSKTLEEKKSLNVTSTLGLNNTTYLSDVVFDDEGNIYTVTIKYEDDDWDNVTCVLYKLDAEGNVIYVVDNLSDLEGSGTVFKRANGNMCIMSSSDYETFFFNELDNETGAVTNRYEVELKTDTMKAMLSNCELGDIVYSDDNGIWKVVLETGKSEKILSFGTDIPEDYKDCYVMSYANGELYMYGQVYGDDSSYLLYKVDRDGNILDEINVGDDGENTYVSDIRLGTNGEIVTLLETYNPEDGTAVYTMRVIDENGNTVSEVDLSSMTEGLDEGYINRVVPLKSGGFAAVVQNYNYETGDRASYIAVTDSEGNFVGTIEDENNEISYISSLISTSSGEYVMYSNNDGYRKMSKINTETLSYEDASDIDIPDEAQFIEADGSYDLCYLNSEGVYGYSIAEKKSTEIVNFIDSDIVFGVENAAFYDSDTLICLGYDYEIGDEQMYFLKRADEETLKKIQNKEIITVAGVNLSYNSTLKNKVVDFNKNSDEYRIQINDYGKYSKYEDDTYVSGAFQLNSDMTAGNVPDVIIGNGEVDMNAFASKKILTDLNAFFEKDEEISKEDYFENVLEAFTYNGKLCQITPEFALSAIAAPASKAGDGVSWTTEEFLALKNNGRIFYKETGREALVADFITSNLTEFVDFENKTCDFNNERFTSIVDFIAEEGYVYDENDAGPYIEGAADEDVYAGRFASGQCQAENLCLSGVFDLLELQQGTINETVALKGYPSENGSGIVINSNSSFAICEKSKNKDAAWKFIKTFLTDEYQDSINEEYITNFPLKKSAFEATLNKAKSQEFTGSYSVTKPDGTVEDMKPLDQATADRIRNAVVSADRYAVYDERIADIVNTALDEVFNDAKSSSEAASEIQNKVSLYLKEIK